MKNEIKQTLATDKRKRRGKNQKPDSGPEKEKEKDPSDFDHLTAHTYQSTNLQTTKDSENLTSIPVTFIRLG
jgi:hypothetical protein